jgi:hypothetical protein
MGSGGTRELWGFGIHLPTVEKIVWEKYKIVFKESFIDHGCRGSETAQNRRGRINE